MRARVSGAASLRLRGEKIERNFAHQLDAGGMDQLWVRDRENVQEI